MDSNQEIQLTEVEIDEELASEEESQHVWPENYETYLGDGIYIESVN